MQAKLSKADSIDLKISENEAKSAAYEQAQSLLATLQSAANALRAPSGSTQKSTDAFEARSAYLSANGNVDASASVSATVEGGSQTGSYDLTVTQLAKSHKVASASQSSSSTDLGYEGVISVGTVGGTTVEIELDADMTLAEIAEAINAQSETTGVQASVLKVSATSYQLVLSGTSAGTDISVSSVSGDDVLTELEILDGNGDFADVLQESQVAKFTLDGIEITRQTNDVDDVLDGVTLHLYQVTPEDTSITLEIGTDLSTVKSAIQDMVDAYNAYRDFAYQQQQLPTEDNEDSTVLFGDGTLRNINSNIANALDTVIDSQSMALLGLSYDAENKLELDEDALDDALLTNLDEIKALLTFQMDSSSSDLMLLSRGGEVPSDFQLDIVTDGGGNITSVAVDGDSSLFTVSGTRIIGKAGTDYEGYTFVYIGDTGSVDISFSAGIAELLYNVTDRAANASDGTLQTLVDQIADTDADLEAKSEDIRSAAETYRTNLTNRYAEYQAAIEEADSMLDYLKQLLETWNSSS